MAQLGVLKVLDRAGIPISYVAGTSGGAVIGAVYATSQTALEAEERILAHLATTGVGFNTETFEALATSNARRPAGFLGMLRTLRRAARRGGGLIGGDAMRASLGRLLGDATWPSGMPTRRHEGRSRRRSSRMRWRGSSWRRASSRKPTSWYGRRRR